MNFDQYRSRLAALGCREILVKQLAPNDNNKNQFYLGGDFSALNLFPLGDIESDSSSIAGSKRERMKAGISFFWLNEDGSTEKATGANLILYPKYPEVRLSGLIRGVKKSDRNKLLANRIEGRMMAFAISRDDKVFAWIGLPTSELGEAVASRIEKNEAPSDGVFHRIAIRQESVEDADKLLFSKLREINAQGWLPSRRLGAGGIVVPCRSSNCGGYTLECELGVQANGYAEPDFEGWEVKQFQAKNFDAPHGQQITLMTPEPDAGFYRSGGVEAFVRKYGYADKMGREDRMNFGGVHRCGVTHDTTKLTLEIDGFDAASGKITNAKGSIALVDGTGEVAAGWSLDRLLKHWNKKHAKAVYVPSKLKMDGKERFYSYGHNVLTGVGADFSLVLSAIDSGAVCYDPGIKLENVSSSSPKTKRRSQFRIKSKDLGTLYRTHEWRNLLSA